MVTRPAVVKKIWGKLIVTNALLFSMIIFPKGNVVFGKDRSWRAGFPEMFG